MELSDKNLFRNTALVGGEWVTADSGESLAVFNPATGGRIGTVPSMGAAETGRAIEAAHAAGKGWSSYTAKERSAILRSWFELLKLNREDLATLMTLEQGKPLAESRGEINYAASFLEWFAEEAKRINGDVTPADSRDKRLIVIKQPVGVCAAITPWNFPAAMITRKVGPALAAGCTVVIKPARQTPFTALALCVLAERAGVPPGVISCVTGSPTAIGGALTSNPLVRKVSFTGSTEIGKILLAQCAATVKKTSMELGGNAPFIVFDDADVDAAVAGAMIAKFRNAGQTCVSANRFLVQDRIYDAFVSKLTDAISALKVGNGLEAGVHVGPLIDAAAVTKVQELVASALSQGAVVTHGGGAHPMGDTFCSPTVLENATQDMEIFHEEIFGPVAAIYSFETEQEAIDLANATKFGLAAYFYGRDIGRVWRLAESLEYGMVGINEGLISTEVAPFGGIKESGMGREGSKYGIEDYLEIKYLCMGGIR